MVCGEKIRIFKIIVNYWASSVFFASVSSAEFIVNKTFIWPPYTFQAGVAVTPSPAQMGTTLVKMMKSKGLA